VPVVMFTGIASKVAEAHEAIPRKDAWRNKASLPECMKGEVDFPATRGERSHRQAKELLEFAPSSTESPFSKGRRTGQTQDD